MRLVFIYGPPGVGKLTVATELAGLTGFKLFHNHLTYDLVTALFPRGTDPWSRLLRVIRREVFAEAAREGVDVVFTTALRAAGAEQLEYARVVTAPVLDAGGGVMYVRLSCEREELIRRLQSEDRHARRKLTRSDVLLAEYDLSADYPFEPQLRLDTTDLPAPAAARTIARHFGLPQLAEV